MHVANTIYRPTHHTFGTSLLIFFNFNSMSTCVSLLVNLIPRYWNHYHRVKARIFNRFLEYIQDKNSQLGSCDFYNKPSAAKDFIALLKKGRSQSWQKTLFEMLGTREFKDWVENCIPKLHERFISINSILQICERPNQC